jgi:acetyl coenzyme A synthetase (ADP forming)-like protein
MSKSDRRIEEIRNFFEPTNGIAVIGASNKQGKVGNAVITSLVKGSIKSTVIGRVQMFKPDQEKIQGFQGKIYPVNSDISPGETIEGLPAYKSLLDIHQPVDVAVIVVPPKFVLNVMKDCAQIGVKSVVIITAGFSELNAAGKDLEKEIADFAHKNKMRIIGPNCLGIIRTQNDLNATFSDLMPPKGPISFISQSGALCTAVINYSIDERIGFANFVSIGNKADVDDADLMEYFARDPKTKVIALYIESVKNGGRFREALEKIIDKVPIVVTKAGRTAAGAQAASSHTGSIVGSDTIYDAVFNQYGVYRAKTMNELFYCAKALGYSPPAKGPNIAILTNSGGPGVLAADEVFLQGLQLAPLEQRTLDALNAELPAAWSHHNPVDILGDALASRYQFALNQLVEDKTVDALIILLAPTAMVEPLETAKIVVETMRKSDKPVSCAWMGLDSRDSSFYLDDAGISEVSFPDRCVRAIKALVSRGRFLKKRGLL